MWNYDYQEFRLILEQADVLHYFNVSASTQRLFTRALIIAVSILLIIIAMLVIYSSLSALRYNNLEVSKKEAEKRRYEALSAIVALSDSKLDYMDDLNQERLIKIARQYRERTEKMHSLIKYSSEELKLASNALEEGLKASGLGVSVISQFKTKVLALKSESVENLEVAKFDDSSSQLLASYENSLTQLEQLKSIYQQFPKKPPTIDAITTSKFGVRVHPITNKLTMHEGLDYISNIDQNATAVLDGVVEKVQHASTGYGNMVVILHPHKIRTTYAHLDSIEVQIGQKVEENDVLGKIGNTGSSTGKHLHYEISVDNIKVNPSIITAIAKNV